MNVNRMKSLAKRLLDEDGRAIDLVKYTRGGQINPDTGEYPTSREVFPTYGYISNYDTSLIVAGVVNMDDLRILFYNFNGQLPDKDWKVSIHGDELTVISVNNVQMLKETFITFELQCRK